MDLKNLNQIKIKDFDHSDLDAGGVAVLLNLAFENKSNTLDIVYCGYNDINKKVNDFIDSGEYKNYDLIFITDISVDKDTAEKIDKTLNNIVLMDHHPTSEWLSKYKWANVMIKDDVEKVSGTSMVYKYLLDNNYIQETPILNEFVEKVKRYDTWLWYDKYNDETCKKLNDLFYILGVDDFVSSAIDKIKNNKGLFNETDKLLLKLEERKIKSYIKKKEKSIEIIPVNKYLIGAVIAEQYINELGNELAANHPEVDFICMITDLNRMSFREKKDIDLGKFSLEYYNGGGHPQSAGAGIEKELKRKILKMILKKKNTPLERFKKWLRHIF